MTEGIDIWLVTDTRYLRQRMPCALAGWLVEEGRPPKFVIADRDDRVNESGGPSGAAPPWAGLREGDLVVARSRHPRALELVRRAEHFGARPLDSVRAVNEVRDKARCSAALERRGLPVPATFVARRPEELAELPSEAFPLLLKPVLGDNGNGLRLVRRPDQLAGLEWPDELVLAQSFLDAGGIDLKVYVAGEEVWAVRRASPLIDGDAAPVRVEVVPAVHELVEACRDEFGLVLFGLDVLELEDGGLAIVDVNEFPNYTGVEEAPAAIGRLVLEAAASGPRETVGRV